MATLFNTRIFETYQGLIKTIDNAVITASLKELTDGSGNQTGLYINTAGDFKVTNVLEWGSLKDTGTGVTITRYVTSTDGIENFDNNTSLPTTAAVKLYVDTKFATSDTLEEVLSFGNTTGANNIVIQKSIQLPTTTTNNGTPTDIGVISFGGTFSNGNRIFNDATGGNLRIQGTDNLQLFAPNHKISNVNGSLIIAGDTGVKLYYQNSEKLITTATGVTITGRLSGLTNPTLAQDATTKSYVDALDAGSDLDITDGTTAGAVNLNTQSLSILGTTNEIDSVVSGQSVTIGLPSSISTNLVGNVTGNLTGNVTGDLTGNVTATSVLANGVTATTQASSDSSEKVATTAYVKGLDNASDLDFSTNSGNGAVNLNTQELQVLGTTNQITTTGSNQNITLSFTATGVTLPDGSIATTQSAGDDSTKIATTSYVDTSAALYLPLAGGTMSGNTIHNDSVKSLYGTGNDAEIYHDGSDFYAKNLTGDLYIDQAAVTETIFFRVSDANALDVTALTISRSGDLTTGRNVTIAGDLTVNGTTTTVNSQTLSVVDPLIQLAKDNTANSLDIGLYGDYNDGTGRYLGLFSDASDGNKFKLFKGTTVEPTTTVNIGGAGYVAADLQVAGFEATTGAFSSTGSFGGVVTIESYIVHEGDVDSQFGFQAADEFRISIGGDLNFLADANGNYLYHNALQKMRTTSGGVFVTGDAVTSSTVVVGNNGSIFAENNLRFKAASDAYIDQNTVGQAIRFRTSSSSSLDTEALLLNAAGNATFAGNITLGGNILLNGGVLYKNSGSIEIKAENIRIKGVTTNENLAGFNENGSVQLFYDNVEKLATTDIGVSLNDNLLIGNAKNIYFVNTSGDHAEITYTSGDGTTGDVWSHSFWQNSQNQASIDFFATTEAAADGNISFRAGGSQKMLIDSSGNVGIGTDSPTSYYPGADNLVIKQDSGEGGMSIVTANDTSGAIYFADGTIGNEQYRGGIGYTHSDDKLFLVSGGQTRVWMNDLGYLGIGTDSPNVRTEIKANVNGNPVTAGSTQTNGALRVRGSATNVLDIGQQSVAPYGMWMQVSEATNLGANYPLIINPNGGNVGIGEDTPLVPLHISRDSASGENIALILDNNDTTVGAEVGMLFRCNTNSSNADFEILARSNGSNDSALIFESDGSVERFRLNKNGGQEWNMTNADVSISGSTGGDVTMNNTTGTWAFRADGSSVNSAVISSSLITLNEPVRATTNIHVGSDSGAVGNLDNDILIEGATGESTHLRMYTLGSSLFGISSDGIQATIGWGSSQAREVNFVNNGAGAIAVGIGTTSPSYKLDVSGTGANNRIRLQETTDDTAVTFLEVENSSNASGSFGVGGAGRTDLLDNKAFVNAQAGTDGLAIGTEGTDSIIFYTKGIATTDQKMGLTPDGELKIGATTGAAARLHIESTALDRKQIIQGNATNQGISQKSTIVNQYPVVTAGTQLIIPFTSQGNLNSTTIMKIWGHSARFNSSDPRGFEATIQLGHLNQLYNVSAISSSGNISGVSSSGMNVIISFTTAYTNPSLSDGVYATIEYMTNSLSYSLQPNNIVMN